jgi:hypothetical protein
MPDYSDYATRPVKQCVKHGLYIHSDGLVDSCANEPVEAIPSGASLEVSEGPLPNTPYQKDNQKYKGITLINNAVGTIGPVQPYQENQVTSPQSLKEQIERLIFSHESIVVEATLTEPFGGPETIVDNRDSTVDTILSTVKAAMPEKLIHDIIWAGSEWSTIRDRMNKDEQEAAILNAMTAVLEDSR